MICLPKTLGGSCAFTCRVLLSLLCCTVAEVWPPASSPLKALFELRTAVGSMLFQTRLALTPMTDAVYFCALDAAGLVDDALQAPLLSCADGCCQRQQARDPGSMPVAILEDAVQAQPVPPTSMLWGWVQQ